MLWTPRKNLDSIGQHNVPVVTLLLRHEAEPNHPDYEGLKSLHHAAERNHSNTVRILLRRGVGPLTPKTKETLRWRLLRGQKASTKGDTLKYICHVESNLPLIKRETLGQVLCSGRQFGEETNAPLVLQNKTVSPSEQFVEMLLAKGVDPNLSPEWFSPKQFNQRPQKSQKQPPITTLQRLAMS